MAKKNNLTKDKILDSARYMFSQKGFDGTSVDEIAKQAGITKSLLYYYYESKDEILLELMKGSMENTISAMRDNIREKPPKDKSQLLEISLKSIEKEQTVLRIALSEALKTQAKTEHIFKLLQAIYQEYECCFRLTPKEKFLYFMFLIKAIAFSSMNEKMAGMLEMDLEEINDIFRASLDPIFDEIIEKEH